MRILIIGGNGMLGHKLVQALSRQFDVRYTIRGDQNQAHGLSKFLNPDLAICNVDVRAEIAIRNAIRESSPDVVINAAGIVKQRPDSADVIDTLLVNSILPHRLANLANETGFRLITISTDCVFSGRKGNYTETDEADATDIYGRSKQLGEPESNRTLVIRTSIIGREIGTQHGLVEWFLSQSGRQVTGYRNAIFSGFPTVVLAKIIADLINEFPELSGLYHVSSEPISKYDLLSLINKQFAAACEIAPADEPRIDRSLDSSRFRAITGFVPQAWPDMIAAMYFDSLEVPYTAR